MSSTPTPGPVEQQQGIRGTWNINHGAMQPKELTFDKKKVRDNLKKEREKHTDKIAGRGLGKSG